jgi:hypothetical protein
MRFRSAALGFGAACLFLFQLTYTSSIEPALYVSYPIHVHSTIGLSWIWIQVYTSEIYPNHLREIGLVYCLVTQIIVDIALISAAPYAFGGIGYKCMSFVLHISTME